MNAQWTALAANAGRTLDASQHDLLNRYLDLLLAANQTMNLTRITDRTAAELQHVSDSLTLLPFLPAGEIKLADVGSGGGVPGIPLAIARPDAYVVLIESTQKKAKFLQRAVAELGLGNVGVSDQRAEDVARTGKRASFDVVTARAVATLDFLAEYCLPLVKIGGKMLAMKGPKVADELPGAQRTIRILGGGEPVIHPVILDGTDRHVIVEIRKRTKTSDKFPRPPSQQKGKPLAARD
jgi:16S rRNA (guanine527-N7)-methyltransferase